MRAVQFDAYGAQPRLVEIAPPACPDDGVVVDVAATGLCRSDWHGWRGHEKVPLPHVPGHELAGVVASVGPAVRSWAAGDRVTVPFVLGCGMCVYCRDGDAQVCPDQLQPGFTGPGSFAEQVALQRADHNLVALPDGVDAVTAAALGCRFATAYRALTVHGRVSAGDWVTVVGCGGVGLSAVMIATALGGHVVAVDSSARALARAAELGAVHTVDAAAGAAAVVELTAGGAHLALAAVGGSSATSTAVASLRRRGRHVQVGLLHGTDARAAVAMDRVVAYELEVYGAHGMAAHEYPAMLAMVESGALDPGRLVGAVIGLDAAGAALVAMDEPAADGITVITP